jgi:hypothetical protein
MNLQATYPPTGPPISLLGFFNYLPDFCCFPVWGASKTAPVLQPEPLMVKALKMLHQIEPPCQEYYFHLTYKHRNSILQSLHHRIKIQIVIEHYWHHSLNSSVVVIALQPIEFTNVDIHCSFYIRHIAVQKHYWIKPLQYLFPIIQFQAV